jgi:2-methylcitrate dehydratase
VTYEDKKWTKKYHNPNPKKKYFGGEVVIQMKDGSKIKSKLSVASAHPSGNKPFKREDYIYKFKTLTKNIIEEKESERFLNDIQGLRELGKSELHKLNIEVKSNLKSNINFKKTIF